MGDSRGRSRFSVQFYRFFRNAVEKVSHSLGYHTGSEKKADRQSQQAAPRHSCGVRNKLSHSLPPKTPQYILIDIYVAQRISEKEISIYLSGISWMAGAGRKEAISNLIPVSQTSY